MVSFSLFLNEMITMELSFLVADSWLVFGFVSVWKFVQFFTLLNCVSAQLRNCNSYSENKTIGILKLYYHLFE